MNRNGLASGLRKTVPAQVGRRKVGQEKVAPARMGRGTGGRMVPVVSSAVMKNVAQKAVVPGTKDRRIVDLAKPVVVPGSRLVPVADQKEGRKVAALDVLVKACVAPSPQVASHVVKANRARTGARAAMKDLGRHDLRKVRTGMPADRMGLPKPAVLVRDVLVRAGPACEVPIRDLAQDEVPPANLDRSGARITTSGESRRGRNEVADAGEWTPSDKGGDGAPIPEGFVTRHRIRRRSLITATGSGRTDSTSKGLAGMDSNNGVMSERPVGIFKEGIRDIVPDRARSPASLNVADAA